MTAELNWAGNYRFQAGRVELPASIEELRRVVASARCVRAVGTRHSFNGLADPGTGGALVSLARMPARVDVDSAACEVRVAAGMRYGDVAAVLERSGWGLGNLASLPHISVAGAIATGTHGSGDANGSLATEVTGLRILRADGEEVALRREDKNFNGAVVSLGALGVVTEVTLRIRPSFRMQQSVIVAASWDRVLEDMSMVTAAAYSVSLFTTWQGPNVGQIWVKELATDENARGTAPAATAVVKKVGGRLATKQVHMLPGMRAANCTRQLGLPGPWNERLPHFRLNFTPSNGEEIQSEYLLDRRHAVNAIEAVRRIGNQLTDVLQVSEIRSIAADTLWLSGAYGRDTIGLHFTWRRDQEAVESALAHIEKALEPYRPRPHWGKAFLHHEGGLSGLYPKASDFRYLTESFDPNRRFWNSYLQQSF
ncbi:MAG: FAD-binding protein [Nakamurella sp.]